MKNELSYDGKSLIVNGKRLFLYSGSVHYFRLPRGEWREALVKCKMSGLNCIDTYIAWNFHEPEEGKWDFAGGKDLDAFLSLCAELGFYVLARPGPYICAEWDFGGFPWWLNNKKDIMYRNMNDVYLRHVDLYLDRVVPILVKHQLTAGGPVILVQSENEYPEYLDGRAYLNHVREGIVARGVNVPMVSCDAEVEDNGAIACMNFWTNADQAMGALKSRQPGKPKMVTEFWNGLYTVWGRPKMDAHDAVKMEGRLFEILRAGFSGINHYMFFGGTNFGSWGGRSVNPYSTINCDKVFVTTSYESDAPLSEHLSITPKYLASKRTAFFLKACAPFLMESDEVPTGHCPAAQYTARQRSVKGQKMLFVETSYVDRLLCPAAFDDGEVALVTVNPGQIVPAVKGFQITGRVKMDCGTFFTLFKNARDGDTLVIWGTSGERSHLRLVFDQALEYDDVFTVVHQVDEDKKGIRFEVHHFSELQIFKLRSGDYRFNVMVMDVEAVDRTWFDRDGQDEIMITGCDEYYSDGGVKQFRTGSRADTARVFGATKPPGAGWTFNGVFGCFEKGCGGIHQGLPSLEDWEHAPEPVHASPVLTRGQTGAPCDFSNFGLDFGYLWYEAEIESPVEKECSAVITGLQDPARAYVNGVEIGQVHDMFCAALRIPLKKGANTLGLLVQNMGRYNFSSFLGEKKGFSGSIYLDGTVTDLKKNHTDETGGNVDLNGGQTSAGKVRISKKFNSAGCGRTVLRGKIGENLKINGREVILAHYQHWWNFICLDITGYVVDGENLMEMDYDRRYVERLELFSYHVDSGINHWKTSARVLVETEKKWASCGQGGLKTPAWYRVKFAKPRRPENTRPSLKLRMTGMGKGFIRVNGNDIGRYWQIGPQEDYKIPWEWLLDENELVIFDEEGRNPRQVRLIWDEASKGEWMA